MDVLQRIQSNVSSGGRYEEYDEESLIRIHHLLMKEYGWIPLEEFRKLPNPTLFNLLNCIKLDKEAETKEYKKMKRR